MFFKFLLIARDYARYRRADDVYCGFKLTQIAADAFKAAELRHYRVEVYTVQLFAGLVECVRIQPVYDPEGSCRSCADPSARQGRNSRGVQALRKEWGRHDPWKAQKGRAPASGAGWGQVLIHQKTVRTLSLRWTCRDRGDRHLRRVLPVQHPCAAG